MAKRNKSVSSAELFDKKVFPDHLETLATKYLRAYSFDSPIKEGKTGATYRIRNRTSKQWACLKTIKPSKSDPNERKNISGNLEKECLILQPLEHRCLPRIFEHGRVNDQYFYVSSYHPGQTFREWAEKKQKLGQLESIVVIRSLLDVLKYLHARGRQHNDLHANNVLLHENVYEFGVMIVDFGSGHRESDSSSMTEMRGNIYMKADSQKPLQNQQVSRQEQNFETADFVALGGLLVEMSAVFFADSNSLIRQNYKEFARSLWNRNIRSWDAAEQMFASVVDPLRIINCNADLFLSETGIPQDITLPVVRSAPVGELSLRVINTSAFQRLRNIRQLSFCDLFFPGAVHTRFEHSLGVFATAKRALERLAHDRAFQEVVSPIQARGLLLAALIHDVGHYPFAHVIEQYAVSRLWRSKAAIAAAGHANNTIEILRDDYEFHEAVKASWGDEAIAVATSLIAKGGGNMLLRSIIDGPIDVDKLDYLRRDAHHCGLAFGLGVDVDALLETLVVVQAKRAIGVTHLGVPAVEGLMILQDQMLASVYWHPVTRGATCMFHAMLAHVVGDDESRFLALIKEVKKCRHEIEAINRVIKPACRKVASKRKNITSREESKKLEERLNDLISFVEDPHYSRLYVPVVEHPRTEQVTRPTNIYRSLVNDFTHTARGDLPVDWKKVKHLRVQYITILKQWRVNVDNTDVVIDVPSGKAARDMVYVKIRGDEEKIVDVSNLPATIFDAPAAFASPVRVYLSPGIIDQLGSTKKREELVEQATERFHEIPVSNSEIAR